MPTERLVVGMSHACKLPDVGVKILTAAEAGAELLAFYFAGGPEPARWPTNRQYLDAARRQSELPVVYLRAAGYDAVGTPSVATARWAQSAELEFQCLERAGELRRSVR